MLCRWVAVTAVAVVVGLTGCSSDGGSSANSTSLPKLTRKDWTPAGLATAKATTAAMAAAIPGQCTDATVSDITQLPFGMQQVHSKIVPTAQMTCTVNDEVVEISVFADAKQRDRFVDDRSTGICRLAAAQAKKYKKPLQFPGLRWVVGAGNQTVQPDSESLARRLALVTAGRYDPRDCAGGVTGDWDPSAVTALDALGKKVADAGHGCSPVDLTGRETLPAFGTDTHAQLPAAVGSCPFDGSPIEIITYGTTTSRVTDLIDDRMRQACLSDPSLGRIDGPGYTVLAGGTMAEQVSTVVGGTLADTSCGALSTTTTTKP